MGTENIKVSICCLAYNHNEYIRRCLDGLLSQRFDYPYEIIVNDDCSTDGTTEIIAWYSNKYPKIVIPIFHNENQFSKGFCNNEQNCFDIARGEYIAFCECDDFWTDMYKLQKQVDFMEKNPDVGLLYTDFDTLLDDGRIIKNCFKKRMKVRPLDFEQHLLHAGYLAPLTWLMRRNVLLELDTNRSVIDSTFVIALEFFKKSKVAYFDESTACRIRHVGSATQATTIQKKITYMQDVFGTQRLYTERYCSNDIIIKQRINEIKTMLPLIHESGDKAMMDNYIDSFIKEGTMEQVLNGLLIENDELRKENNKKNYIGRLKRFIRKTIIRF